MREVVVEASDRWGHVGRQGYPPPVLSSSSPLLLVSSPPRLLSSSSILSYMSEVAYGDGHVCVSGPLVDASLTRL
jgi:hypothetical protein